MKKIKWKLKNVKQVLPITFYKQSLYCDQALTNPNPWNNMLHKWFVVVVVPFRGLSIHDRAGLWVWQSRDGGESVGRHGGQLFAQRSDPLHFDVSHNVESDRRGQRVGFELKGQRCRVETHQARLEQHLDLIAVPCRYKQAWTQFQC